MGNGTTDMGNGTRDMGNGTGDMRTGNGTGHDTWEMEDEIWDGTQGRGHCLTYSMMFQNHAHCSLNSR